MKLENTGIEDRVMDLKPLDHLMGKNAFIRAAQWDYERVTYDYKINTQEKGATYYIRIQGYATEGDVDIGDAKIKLLTPILGKHYYPHGIEYGEENFSESLIERATGLVIKAREALDGYNG